LRIAQPSTCFEIMTPRPTPRQDKSAYLPLSLFSLASPFTGSRPGCPTHMFSWPGPGPTHILAGGAGDIRMNQLHSTYSSNNDSTSFGRWVNREPLPSLCSVCIERTCFFFRGMVEAMHRMFREQPDGDGSAFIHAPRVTVRIRMSLALVHADRDSAACLVQLTSFPVGKKSTFLML
jgi:hypothetical protein